MLNNLISWFFFQGDILDLQKCGWNQLDLDDHFICVNPIAFTKLLCRFHIAEETQEFRLTSSHFWPDKQNKPSVESLVQVLETVQVRGIISETLFPVLWQEFPTLDESKVKLLLQVFISLGMLLPLHSSIHGSSLTALSLPTYPTLSPNKYYYASVIDCFNDLRPQLNWTPKPYPGDLQVRRPHTHTTAASTTILKFCPCIGLLYWFPKDFQMEFIPVCCMKYCLSP